MPIRRYAIQGRDPAHDNRWSTGAYRDTLEEAKEILDMYAEGGENARIIERRVIAERNRPASRNVRDEEK